MKRKTIIGYTIVLTLLSCSILLLFFFSGTPWGKRSFEHQTKNYLQNNLPFLTVNSINVYYSFTEGEYRSKVKIRDDISFTVQPDFNGNLTDSYNTSQWEHEVSTAAINIAKSIFENDLYVECKIIGERKGNFNSYNLPSYSIASESLKINSRLILHLQNELDYSDESYKKIYQFVSWLKSKNYLLSVSIRDSQLNISKVIDYEDLDNITDYNDVKNFLK